MTHPILVLTNVPDLETARQLAAQLVEQRLAACVNCLPQLVSVYRWQGSIETANEVSMMIKTTADCYPGLEKAIQAAHPYELPEIIALPIERGLPAYLDWINQETNKDASV